MNSGSRTTTGAARQRGRLDYERVNGGGARKILSARDVDMRVRDTRVLSAICPPLSRDAGRNARRA
jgi:hypothetical protein